MISEHQAASFDAGPFSGAGGALIGAGPLIVLNTGSVALGLTSIFLGAAAALFSAKKAAVVKASPKEFVAGGITAFAAVATAAYFGLQSPSAPDSPAPEPTPTTAVEAAKPAANLNI